MGGGTVARTTHFALHRLDFRALMPESTQPLFEGADGWLGALVPKRWARRAVTRNTIKRQIYSLGAAWAARWPATAHVVRLRAEFDRTAFVSATSPLLRRAIRAELDLLFSRAPSPAVDGASA